MTPPPMLPPVSAALPQAEPALALASVPASAPKPGPVPGSGPVVPFEPAGAPPMNSPWAAPENLQIPSLHLPGPTDPGDRTPTAPPQAGSVLQQAELKVLHVVQDHRTPEGDAWAQKLDAKLGLPIWLHEVTTLKQNHGVVIAAKAAAMLTKVLGATAVATQVAKHKIDRERPYEADPTIIPVVPKPHDASFPSGHTSNAFAAAHVLSHYEPERTNDLYRLAAEVAASRIYAGVHYPTDVLAGALLGQAVASAAMNKAKPEELG